MSFEVKKAVRQRRPLKVSMEGLSGGGKTYTALRLAFAMRRAGIGRRIVVIDSENESAGLYAGVTEDGERWEYETVNMPQERRDPAGYTEAYEYVVAQGFDIVIVDSLSHAWHGAQRAVDQHARANKGDKLGGWANVTPQQQTMIQTLTDTRAHCISTMRVKSDFQDQDVNGRVRKVKVGLKADQRDNTEYEYDLVLRFEANNECLVEKVRGCSAMNGKSAVRPGPAFFKPLFDWWLSAEAAPPPAPKATAPGLPATGEELHQRLREYDKKLAAQKLCQPGALLAYVTAVGVKAGHAANMNDWSGPAIPFAVERVKAFEAAAHGVSGAKDVPSLAGFWQSLDDDRDLQRALTPEKEKRKGDLTAARERQTA